MRISSSVNPLVTESDFLGELPSPPRQSLPISFAQPAFVVACSSFSWAVLVRVPVAAQAVGRAMTSCFVSSRAPR